MKILFIGQLYVGSTCVDRMSVLEEMEHEVISFNTTPWLSKGSRILLSLAHRVNTGPNIRSLNRSICSFADSMNSSIDMVWVEKGVWVYAETLAYLKQLLSSQLLHYTPDPQIVWHKSRHFNKALPFYDWVVTTKPFEVEGYKKLGAKNVVFVLQGAGSHFVDFQACKSNEDVFLSDVCFVGHYESYYGSRLNAITENINGLRVWGPGWRKFSKKNHWPKNKFGGDGVWGTDYLKVLSSAKIAIGLLSKVIPETTTTRTFEIPAIGTFLLAERTNDHLALYEEGVEAEFFDSDAEMNDKIQYYLNHDVERERIAAAGKKRFIESSYGSEFQIGKVMARVLT